MQGVLNWLFTDPITAGNRTASGNPEQFHFYLPWIIFCSLAILIPFYYGMEGRKRFFGAHGLNKYIFDRIMNQLWPLGLVGFVLIAMRAYFTGTLFQDRFWRYGWALWAVGLAIYWMYYFAARYGRDLAWYRNKRTLEKYYPKPRAKRRPARAGAR